MRKYLIYLLLISFTGFLAAASLACAASEDTIVAETESSSSVIEDDMQETSSEEEMTESSSEEESTEIGTDEELPETGADEEQPQTSAAGPQPDTRPAEEQQQTGTLESQSETHSAEPQPETQTDAAPQDPPAVQEPSETASDPGGGLMLSAEPVFTIPASLHAAERYSKIIIASAPSATSTTGTLSYYRQGSDGAWETVLSVPCYFGWDGVGAGSEYSSCSPVGIYTFIKLFGSAPDPGCIMGYTQLDGDEYWCGEQYYNQWVDSTMDHSQCSLSADEHLLEMGPEYEYCAAFSYNMSCTPGRGSAFFLHVTANIPTAGCVSVSRDAMVTLMRIIDGRTCFIIDTEANIASY